MALFFAYKLFYKKINSNNINNDNNNNNNNNNLYSIDTNTYRKLQKSENEIN